MKKYLVLIFAVLVTIGCATKEEKARTLIQKTWRIDKVFENGQDVTATYTTTRVNYRITFDGNNRFIEKYQLFAGEDEITVTGTWDFSTKATQLILSDSNQTRVYRVEKLDENHLKVTDEGTNNDRMIEFVPL